MQMYDNPNNCDQISANKDTTLWPDKLQIRGFLHLVRTYPDNKFGHTEKQRNTDLNISCKSLLTPVGFKFSSPFDVGTSVLEGMLWFLPPPLEM